MRKILLLLGIFFMCALTARGQGGFTTVTGTITGPIDGIVWSCATISAQLITAGGVAPTLNGGGFTTSTSPVSLGCPGSNGLAPGSFSIRLADSGVISPATTTWQFTVNMAPGIAPPAGTGPQSFTYTTAINCSTNTPSVCTANSMSISAQLSALAPRLSNASGGTGTGFPVSTSVNVNSGGNINVNTGGAITINSGGTETVGPGGSIVSAGGVLGPEGSTISPLGYGYKPDVKVCLGKVATMVINSGSGTITCSTGPFLPSDTGKSALATAGCCINTLYGTPQVLNDATVTYVNATTITVSPTPIASCTTTCILAWGTAGATNDTALFAAEAAWIASATPMNFHFPAGWGFVEQGHFHAAGANWNGGSFTNLGNGLMEYGGGSITGEGNSVSMLVPGSGFSFTTGSGNSCGSGSNTKACFGGNGSIGALFWREWGIIGLHQSLTGGNHSVNFVEPGAGGKLLNMSLALWGDADTSALGVAGAGGNITSSSIDNFGGGGGTFATTGIVWLYQNFIGESNGTSFSATGGPIISVGNYFGQVNSSSPIVTMATSGLGNAWYSYADYVYDNISANSNVFCQLATTHCIFEGMQDDNTGTAGAFNALYCPGICSIHNSIFKSPAGGFALVTNGGAAGGTIFNEGGNTITGPISSSVIPTWTSTGTGTTPCTPTSDSYSFNEGGSFTCTAAVGALATGTFIMTFAGTPSINGQPPACTLTLKDGTGAWTLPVSIKETASTTTSYTWAWFATAALTSTSTYRGTWSCPNISR
jgi:fibronectin-binding autotransporter adhesin